MIVLKLPRVKEKLVSDGVSSQMIPSDESLKKRRDFIKSQGLDPKMYSDLIFAKDQMFNQLEHH